MSHIDTKIRHVTSADGNIFVDLGLGPEEAAALLAESDRIIAEKLAIKESLMTEIAVWIEEKKLKQVEAAKIQIPNWNGQLPCPCPYTQT